jgi:hypothetical protein
MGHWELAAVPRRDCTPAHAKPACAGGPARDSSSSQERAISAQAEASSAEIAPLGMTLKLGHHGNNDLLVLRRNIHAEI